MNSLFDNRERWLEGMECPCCNQNVKLYKRKLNSNMARFLCSLVSAWKREASLLPPGEDPEPIHHDSTQLPGPGLQPGGQVGAGGNAQRIRRRCWAH